MPGFIFLLLPLSIIIVFALAALAFADVALRQSFVSGCPSASGPTGWGRRLLAQEIASVQRVTAASSKIDSSASCACETFVPLVTDPEADAIVWELKEHNEELQQVVSRLQRHGGGCPMRSETGVCACSTARPFSCIGRCLVADNSPDWTNGLGDTVLTAFRHHLEDRHVNARTRRLDEALGSLLSVPSESAV
jgi:hypothetical protein